jgi:hypothetical protein
VLVRDRGYEDWFAQQIAVDPVINAEDYFFIRAHIHDSPPRFAAQFPTA